MVRPRRTTEDTKAAIEVGRRLKEIREMARLSQAEFIERLGMKNRRTLGAYEAGRVQISAKLARRLCTEFDISFEWLMTGKEPMSQSAVISELIDKKIREEAMEALEKVRGLVAEHNRGDDPISKSLKISLDPFARGFRPELGAGQITEFLTAVVGTASHLLPDAVVLDPRFSDMVSKHSKAALNRQKGVWRDPGSGPQTPKK